MDSKGKAFSDILSMASRSTAAPRSPDSHPDSHGAGISLKLFSTSALISCCLSKGRDSIIV